MSQFYIPTFSEILNVSRSRGGDSRAPGLWRGLVGAWPLQEPGGLTAFDVSGYHNHGTLTNMDAATDHVVTPMGRALDFDGTSDYVQIGRPACLDLGSAAPITLAAWVNSRANNSYYILTSQPEASPYQGHGFLYGGGASNRRPVLSIRGSTSDIYIIIQLNAASALVLNTLYHVVVTYDGSLTKEGLNLFVNGVNQSDVTRSSAGVMDAVTYTKPWRIGTDAHTTPTAWFNGLIGQPAIWNRVLAPSEIRSLYTDPWGMYRLRRRVQVRGAAAGNRRRRVICSAV